MGSKNKILEIMKKSIFYLAFFLFTAPMVMAQEFNVGTNVINAGIGFGGSYDVYNSASQSPGFSFTYERGMWDIPGPGVISLGAYLGFKAYKYDYSGYSSKWSYTTIGVRGAYHFNGLEVDNLDLYGGIMFNYNFLSYSTTNYDIYGNYDSTFGVTPFAGARWFFTDNFGVFGELSYGVAYFSAGVSFKF